MIDNRVFLPLTQLDKLCEDIPIETFSPHEIYPINEFYGMGTVLKQYTGLPHEYRLKAIYHHGAPVFSSYLWKHNLSAPTNLVWSGAGIEAYSKHSSNPTFAIGPIIHYAKNCYSAEQVQQEKKRLGFSALVFPSHSSHHVKVHFDTSNLLNRVKDLTKKFDTVRICIYWKDYLSGMAQPFLEAGYECVTAGHIFDPFFFPRLKGLFSVADHCFGNSLGTQIGLSVFMGVPYTHWPDNVTWDEDPFQNSFLRTTSEADKLEKQQILQAFSHENHDITQEQLSFCEKHWGLSCIQSPAELKNILLQAEIRYQLQQTGNPQKKNDLG